MSRDDNFYMKIVMIHGQNHKGSTWNVANILLQNIPGEKKSERILFTKRFKSFLYRLL